MRVMLFTQTGDSRPKCVKSFGWISGDGSASPRALQYLHSIRFGTEGQPDAGWLVACENPEAGRGVIAWARTGGPDPIINEPCPFGRILASGGRREA